MLESTKNILSVDDLSELTRRIEKEYRSSLYPNIIYNWTPDGSASGDALAIAYAYSYYELFAGDRVSCFIVTANDSFASAIPTVKYINTDLRDEYVDDDLVIRIFGKISVCN